MIQFAGLASGGGLMAMQIAGETRLGKWSSTLERWGTAEEALAASITLSQPIWDRILGACTQLRNS